MALYAMIYCFLPHATMEMVLQNACFNAVGVALSKRNPP